MKRLRLEARSSTRTNLSDNVDDEQRMVSFDLMMATLSVAARRELQAMAGSGQYQFISEFAQKHIEQGRAEGRMEGRAEALLQVLDHRGFSVDQPLRDRIAAASMAQLDDWLVRAVDASALADIFRDD